MLNKKKRNNKGFTLVELLVVIAIIGILAVVAVPSLMKNINKAKAADIVADYSTIKTVVVSQYTEGTLELGTYTKAKNATSFTATSQGTTGTIDVSDLNKEAEYVLNVTASAATLQIKHSSTDILDKIYGQIEGTKGTGVVTVELIK